ncbi:MAG: DNA polymerase III subunit delta [Planctomycetota bacterium]|jgi:DNA polymerase-3 subunit delta|nr:DNA polymerase III subunit delta [Planctomycetota bacterium]MDP7131965.1 DNA polymerase III subunit delta [Planctomycetota bacterium]
MTTDEFLQAFKRAPVYVFFGNEEFFKSQGVNRIKNDFYPEGADSLGLADFEPDEIEMATVLDELRTQSLFGGDRLVLLKGADKFLGFSRGGDEDTGKGRTNRELLESYLAQPASGSALVITTNGAWGNYKKLVQAVKKTGFYVECKRPWDNQIPQWVMRRSQDFYGKPIAPRAAAELAEFGGESLQQLDTQLEQLATFVGRRNQIAEEDVNALIGHHGHHTIFKLTEAAASKQPGRAINLFKEQLQNGTHEGQVLALLAWQFRRLWTAQKLLASGIPPLEVQSQLKLRGRNATLFMGQLRQFTEQDLRRNHRLLLEADVASKSGTDPEMAVEQLIVKLCR